MSHTPIAASHVRVKRAYEAPSPDDGARILIDRLWPRGVKKEALQLADWNKALAPSTALRQWFNHEPPKWDEFAEFFSGSEGREVSSTMAFVRLLNRLMRDTTCRCLPSTSLVCRVQLGGGFLERRRRCSR